MEQTYSQEYYERNKDKIKDYLKEKTECECGKIISRSYMYKHKKSDIHIASLRHKEYLEKKKATEELAI